MVSKYHYLNNPVLNLKTDLEIPYILRVYFLDAIFTNEPTNKLREC